MFIDFSVQIVIKAHVKWSFSTRKHQHFSQTIWVFWIIVTISQKLTWQHATQINCRCFLNFLWRVQYRVSHPPHMERFFWFYLGTIPGLWATTAASRAVMIPTFLEPIPEPVPQTKWATTGADSTLELVPVVEPTPILESAPIVELAPKYGHQN